jgi:hypothetical protein
MRDSFAHPLRSGLKKRLIMRSRKALIPLLLLCAAVTAYSKPADPIAQPASAPSNTASLILGVLEHHVPDTLAASPTPRVRVLFTKKGTRWLAFPTATRTYHDLKSLPLSYPPRVTWTIAFDGRDLGQITTQRPEAFDFYNDIGLESIVSHKPIPSVGKPSTAFATWTAKPVLRPLVALSQPNYKDPDHWKPDHPSPSRIARARALFRSSFPTTCNCRNEYSKEKPWHYSNSEIKLLKAYSSKNGWALVKLGLTGYRCDYVLDAHSPFIGQWYVLNPAGSIRHLGSGMWLVDTGDYDNSGSSSLLFALGGQNMDGYRLYYQNFSKSVQPEFRS